MNVNHVTLAGRLCRDPSLKYLPSQTAVMECGIVCNRKWKNAQGEEKDEATFVDIVAFGKCAEAINQFFSKGKEIFVMGRLKFDSWDDKNGGGKRSKLSVVVESFQFVGSNNGNGGGQQVDRSSDQTRSQKSGSPIGDEAAFIDADIPF